MQAIVQQLAYAMQNQNQQVNQMIESQNQLLMQMREEQSGCGEKGGGGGRSQEDRLNGKAMTAVDTFKGGEAEWIDW